MISAVDRKFIENKYHDTEKPFNAFKRREYHGYAYPNNGLDDQEIIDGLKKLAPTLEGLPRPVIKARAICFVLENTKIDVNEHDYFIGFNTWDRQAEKITYDKWIRELFASIPEMNTIMQDYVGSGAMHMAVDFDHVVPDWHVIMDLGFKGILERSEKHRKIHIENGTYDEAKQAFFDGIKIEYEGIINFIDRLYKYALTQTHEKAEMVAECLKHLRDGAPQNTFDALQLIYLYFMISESVDSFQVRSLGNGLDNTIYKFYVNDIKNGRFTREEIKNFLSYFLMQWSAIGNYWGQPVYFGGTNLDGTTKINDLSHDIIDVYNELGIYNPKLQIKLNYNTPKDFIYKVLDMIRKGKNCFTFCCEPTIIKSMMGYGATYKEALEADIRGCYEVGVRANEVSTGCGCLNLLKPVLYVLYDGYDTFINKQLSIKTGGLSEFKTFEDFYFAFLKHCDYILESSIKVIDQYEKYLGHVSPSSMYSATIENVLVKGEDGYQSGVKFNNSSIAVNGFASAVDALMAIKKFVYDDKIVTLKILKDALDNDWVGYEVLHNKILNCKYKYGNNEQETDTLAKGVASWLCAKINNRNNARGGKYKIEAHSAMHFVWKGARTQATPDGRKAGDETSKNGSPSVGMDRLGATALINSATKLDPFIFYEGFCLDLMLHTSSVSGENGLDVMYGLINTYLKNGGGLIQMNVFNKETLLDAQKNPEKYKNLQVRVCGWNVLWNNLSKKEQDAYILRAEHIAE